jgi:hypothetical protein
MQHTKEPWLIGGKGSEHLINVKQDGVSVNIFQALGDNTKPDEDRANAKRAVECVNACEGMANPSAYIAVMKKELDDIRQTVSADENESTFDEVERLKAQRNRLLSVLRKIEEGFDTGKITQVHYDLFTEATEAFKDIEIEE